MPSTSMLSALSTPKRLKASGRSSSAVSSARSTRSAPNTCRCTLQNFNSAIITALMRIFLEQQSKDVNLRPFIVFLMCIVLMVGSVMGVGYFSSCNQPPIKGSESGKADHSDKKDCSSSIGIFNGGISETGTFIHDHHEEIIAVGTVFIAVFTIVLGLFTVSLAASTDKLVRGGEDTSKRQLRAYVFLDGIDLRRFNDAAPNISPWRFRIAWKNTGSTRARRFVSKVSHDLIDLTNQPLEGFAFQDEPDAQIFRGLIGSNQSVNPPPIPVLDLHLHS